MKKVFLSLTAVLCLGLFFVACSSKSSVNNNTFDPLKAVETKIDGVKYTLKPIYPAGYKVSTNDGTLLVTHDWLTNWNANPEFELTIGTTTINTKTSALDEYYQTPASYKSINLSADTNVPQAIYDVVTNKYTFISYIKDGGSTDPITVDLTYQAQFELVIAF